MRGSPPIQLFLLVLVFVALAIPLVHLTGNAARGPELAPQVEKTAQEVKSLIRVRFVHKPENLSLKLGDRELVEKAEWDENAVELTAKLPPHVEIAVSADWPYGAPDQALTIEIEPDGLDGQSVTHWSSAGSLKEIYSFKW